mgnify:CR=1 FL=1
MLKTLSTVVKPSRNIDLEPDNSIVGHSVHEPTFVSPENTILLDRFPKAVIGTVEVKWSLSRVLSVRASCSECLHHRKT